MSVLCTIGIPVYNRKAATLRAVHSALAQDIEGLEIIVVDDGSSDGTPEAIEAINDPRLKVVRNEKNLGLFQNFNRCLELAQGKYFRLLCTDDELTPNTLRKEIALVKSNEDISILSTSGIIRDANGDNRERFAVWLDEGIYTHKEAIKSVIDWNCRYALNALNYPSGILVRTEHAKAIGGYEIDWKMMGDIDFFLRLTEKGKLYITRHVGCIITSHSEQVGTKLALNPIVSLEFIKIIQKYRHITGDRLSRHCLKYVFTFWILNILKLGIHKQWKAMHASLTLLRAHCRKHDIALIIPTINTMSVVADRIKLRHKRNLR